MPSIRTQFTWLLVFCLVFTQVPLVYAEDAKTARAPADGSADASGIDRFTVSGDVELSEDARSGVAVSVVAVPAHVQAGEYISIKTLLFLVGLGAFATDVMTTSLALLTDVMVGAAGADQELRDHPGATTEQRQAIINKHMTAALSKVESRVGHMDDATNAKLQSTLMTLGVKVLEKLMETAFEKFLVNVLGDILTIVGLYGTYKSIESIAANAKDISSNLQMVAEMEPHLPIFVPSPGLAAHPIAGTGLVLTDALILLVSISNQNEGSNPGGGAGGGPTDLIVNGNFASGLTGWQATGSSPVMSSFGPILPPSGSNGLFASVNTGLGEASGQGTLVQVINVPTSRQASFEVLYNFVTTEFPTFYGTQYNDSFAIIFEGPAGRLVEEQSALNEHPREAYAPVDGLPANLLDQAVGNGGQLGWRMFRQQNLALSPGNYTLRIEVRDVTDQIYDSAVLVDRASLK